MKGFASAFSWTQARAQLAGLPGGGLNIAHEAIDRHVIAGRGEKLALRWIGRNDRIRDFSYADLRAQTNRFANSLKALGVTKSDRVFSLLGRSGIVTLLVDGRRCLQRVLPSSRSGHCSPCPHSFAAKLAKCLTADQVTLNVEGIVDGGVC